MLGYVYGDSEYLLLLSYDISAEGFKDHGSLSSTQSLGIKVATPVGTLVGQLLIGYLADVVGRKKICMWLWSSGSYY